MRLAQSAFCLSLLLLPRIAAADAAGELGAAVNALARTSYRWETTTRQRFSGETTEPRLHPGAPLEVHGRVEPDGYFQITLEPSRELAVPVTAITRHGDVVVRTPDGWLRRPALRQLPAPDRLVEFEGKQVRLSRVFGVALKASALRPLAEELLDLIVDLKSVRREQSLIVAELREATIEKLWGDAQARRAPEIQGTVIFKVAEQGLSEYHVLLAIGFPNSRTKKTSWSMQQWTTRISGLGSTKVDPPPEAQRALEK